MKSIIIFTLLVSFNVQPATFIVNSTSDSIDNNPGNGICQNSFGNCSLRAAIMESNALPGADTVYLQRSTTYELALAAGATEDSFGDLDILDSLTLSIINPGTPAQSAGELPVIDANGIGRVLDVFNALSVTLFAVVITGGDSSNESFNTGGGILVSTPITTSFNVLNSIVIGNKAAQGAGIQTFAAETLISFSDFSLNFLLESQSLNPRGAAINNEAGEITIQFSSIHNNGMNFSSAFCYGAVRNTSTTADMFIFNSTIALNGTSVNSDCISGVRVIDSKISMVNTTIYNNSGWGLQAQGFNDGSDLFVRNSIIADNEINDCLFNGSITTNNFGDANGGNNLTSNASCNMPNISGNMENTDPKLDEGRAVFPGLAPTYIYYEPLPDSPAVDTGSPLAVNIGDADACQQFDQILRTRPIDGDGNGTAVCDIGAIEYNYDLIFKSEFE